MFTSMAKSSHRCLGSKAACWGTRATPPEKHIPPPLCSPRDPAPPVHPHTAEAADRGQGADPQPKLPSPTATVPSWLPGYAIGIALISGLNTYQGQLFWGDGRDAVRHAKVFPHPGCLSKSQLPWTDTDHPASLEPGQQVTLWVLAGWPAETPHCAWSPKSWRQARLLYLHRCQPAPWQADLLQSSIRLGHSIPPACLDHSQRNGNVRDGNHFSQTAHPRGLPNAGMQCAQRGFHRSRPPIPPFLTTPRGIRHLLYLLPGLDPLRICHFSLRKGYKMIRH